VFIKFLFFKFKILFKIISKSRKSINSSNVSNRQNNNNSNNTTVTSNIQSNSNRSDLKNRHNDIRPDTPVTSNIQSNSNRPGLANRQNNNIGSNTPVTSNIQSNSNRSGLANRQNNNNSDNTTVTSNILYRDNIFDSDRFSLLSMIPSGEFAQNFQSNHSNRHNNNNLSDPVQNLYRLLQLINSFSNNNELASHGSIENIPKIIYKRTLDENDICTICRYELEDGIEIRDLYCKHGKLSFKKV
jgi:hypothetical protein